MRKKMTVRGVTRGATATSCSPRSSEMCDAMYNNNSPTAVCSGITHVRRWPHRRTYSASTNGAQMSLREKGQDARLKVPCSA
jgi:hypothetical protein